MITIDNEAKQRAKLPTDMDKMAERYKTTNGYYTFTSPSLWAIEKNLWFLLRNSVEKELEPKYVMRPDYLSFDEYGTVSLAFLLMYVNGIFSIEDFDQKTVVVPSFTSIVDMCQDNFPVKDADDLDSIDW